MARITHVTGVSSIMAKLRAVGMQQGMLMEGRLKRAGLFVQRESQKVVPVEYAVLKNSAFTRKLKGIGFTADIAVGYTAFYAAYVHEDLQARHKPGKKAKYLEHPVIENRRKILAIIAGTI